MQEFIQLIDPVQLEQVISVTFQTCSGELLGEVVLAEGVEE